MVADARNPLVDNHPEIGHMPEIKPFHGGCPMTKTDPFPRKAIPELLAALILGSAFVAAGQVALAGGVLGIFAAAIVMQLFRREADWWHRETRSLGKGLLLLAVNALWPLLRRVLRPDFVWVTYPGTEDHKRAYMPPWVERLLRPVFPTGYMRFSSRWGIVISSLETTDSLSNSRQRVRVLLDEIRAQFPGVPVALAGRLPSIATSAGVELSWPFTHGDRGTVWSMAAAAHEAASSGGGEPFETTVAVVGSKGFIGSRLVSSLSGRFRMVIALDVRYQKVSSSDDHVLFTNRPEALRSADVVFVLTARGADMATLAPHIAPGAIVADDTHPEMPARLRAKLERRGATVLKATLGDRRFQFVPRIPDFRADDIPGCILEALVVVARGRDVLESQERFDGAAQGLRFRARLAPHRNRAQNEDRE